MAEDEHHKLDVAHMLPQRTLMSMHEEDHSGAEPAWHGSSDASRGHDFVARRTR